MSIYNGLKIDFFEGHHIVPLKNINGEYEITTDEIIILCPNCHRIVHNNPDVNMDHVQDIVNNYNCALKICITDNN